MNNITCIRDGYTYVRVNKTKARNLYRMNKPIFALPCKANPANIWNRYSECYPAFNMDEDRDTYFNKWINLATYYNCHDERGRYLAFYARECDI